MDKEVIACNRCSSINTKWNDAGYFICMNCGRILVRPIREREIIAGIMEYATTVKERLWRLRVADEEEVNDE